VKSATTRNWSTITKIIEFLKIETDGQPRAGAGGMGSITQRGQTPASTPPAAKSNGGGLMPDS
jgi:hypothetical protein